jgi:hypothetical protein
MGAILAMLGEFVRLLIGVAVLGGIMYFVTRSHALMWRSIVSAFGGASSFEALTRITPETIVITKSGAVGGLITGNLNYTLYAWTSLATHQDGLSINAIFPASLMCRPIFLPFDQMTTSPARWNLWSNPIAINMDGLPDLVIILGDQTHRALFAHLGEIKSLGKTL